MTWKPRLFACGLVALFFSILVVFSELLSTEPNYNDLNEYKGAVDKIEKWRIKNKFGTDIFLFAGETKRFVISICCEPTLHKLFKGQTITINYTISSSISRVIGSIKHITGIGEVICKPGVHRTTEPLTWYNKLRA